MYHLPKIQKGDEMVLVSPSRYVEEEWIEKFTELLDSKGFKTILSPNLFSRENQFAGSDNERIEDMQWAINHPTAKAIWAIRGGYGAIRVLPHLNFSTLFNKPKWMVGYSDFCVFHIHLNNLQFPTLHATMPIHISDRQNFITDFHNTLDLMQYGHGVLDLTKAIYQNKANEEGILVGGNLSILYSMLGGLTKDFFKNKILFLEDIGEYLYHIDRMVQTLYNYGVFNSLSGLLIGSMEDMQDNKVPFGHDIQSIFESKLKRFSYPRVYGVPCGHSNPNGALFLGQNAQITDNQLILNY